MLRKRKEIDYTKQIVSDSSMAGKNSNKPQFQNYFDAPDPPKRKGAEGIVHIDQNNKVTLNIGMMEPTDMRQSKNLMQSFAVQERKKKCRKSVHTQEQQTTVRQKQVSSLAHDLEDCREFLEEKARDQSGENGMVATTSYYPGPAVFSFDEPSLVYERSCLVCGAFGNDDELLTCDLCGESFHPFCVGLQISNLDEQALERLHKCWKCLNCRFCEVCCSASEEYSRIVYCDVCDKAYHLLCLKPQLKHIPNVMWRCPLCFQCSCCKSHKFWNGSDQEFQKMNLSKRLSSGAMQSIELKEQGTKIQKESAVDLRRQLQLRVIEDYKYSFTEDFTLCYQCGMEKYLKHYCVVCKENALLKKTKEKDGAPKFSRNRSQPESNKEEEEKIGKISVIQCQTCKGWCHVTCTHLPGRFKDKILSQELPFKCLNCLIKNRSLHEIYSQACENYLMINKIVKRHAMLANVCRCILAKYFPKGAKEKMKDGIIELFVRDNQEFFDTDSYIHKWLLDLLGSSFVNDPELQDSPNEQEQKEAGVQEEFKEQSKSETRSKTKKQIQLSSQDSAEKYGTSKLLKREMKRMLKSQARLQRKEKQSELQGSLDRSSKLLYSVKGPDHSNEIDQVIRQIEITKLGEQISKTSGISPLSRVELLDNLSSTKSNAKGFLTDLVLAQDNGDGTLGTMSSILLLASETAERMKEDKPNQHTQSPTGKTKVGAASTPKSINTQPDQSQLIQETEMMLHQILPKARDIDTEQSCFQMVNDPVYLEQYRESFLPQPRSFYQQFYYTTHYPRPHNTAAASAIKSLAENKDLKKDNPGPLPILQRPFSEAQGYYTVLPNNTIDQESYEHSNGPVPAPVASAAFKRLRKSNVDDIVRHVSGTLDKYIRNQRTNYSFVQNYFIHEYPAVVRIQTKFQRWVVSDLGKKARDVIAAYKTEKPKSSSVNTEIKVKEDIPAVGLENFFTDLPFDFGIHDDEEVSESHPSKKLKCSLCGRMGNFSLSGRLLPADNGKFIHSNCALFSNDVFQIDNGTLINVFQVLKQSKTIKCFYCDKLGATVACFAKRCQHWYHLHCGLQAEMRFLPSKRSFCKQCFRPGSKNISSVDLQEIKQQGLQIQKGEYSIEKYKWETWNTERKLVISRHSVQCRSLSDIEECEFNLWRPYVCDKFNRIGNMTVIRLNSQIMKLWGSYTPPSDTPSPRADGPSSGYVGVKVYWKLSYLDEHELEEDKKSDQIAMLQRRAYLVVTNKEEEERVFYYKSSIPFSLEELIQLRSSKTLNESLIKGKWYDTAHFFQDFLKQYSQEHTNFTLTNLVFGPQRFYGLETYPIKFWNNCSEDYKFVILKLPSTEVNNMKAAGKLIVDEYGRPVSYSDTPGLARQQSLLKSGELDHSVLFGKRSTNVKRNLLNLKTGYQFDRAHALNSYFSRIVSSNNKPYQEKEEEKLQISDLKDPDVLLGSWTVKKEQILLAMQGGLLKDTSKTQEQEEEKRHDALVSQGTCVLFGVRYLFNKAPFKYLSYDRSLHHPTNALAIVQAQNLRAKQQRKQLENRQNQNAAAKKIGGSKLPIQGASSTASGDREMAQRLKELDLPIAMKYRNFIQNPKKIAVAPSRIHKNGLFARQTIYAGQIVAEYVGQLVRNIVADQRQIMYKAGQGFGDLYFFRLDHEYVVDATFRGGKARYLNHSCEPNCVTKVHLIHHARHILIFAKRMIKIGEEVTFNYCLESESQKLVCHCGAPSCQGRMN